MSILSVERAGGSLLLCTSALCMSMGMTLAATTPASAQSAGSNEPALEEVIVTGSRILRRDDTAHSPLMTVTTEDLTNTSSISIDQQLVRLPQFVPGSDQFNNSGSTQATPTSSPGVATANLRGLGSNRTLVLLDGRRRQPADASLVVDLNTIPTLAIDTVEIITGGAGSTYGADAVAGVVNFRLKRDFEGVSFDARYGMTEEGDGEEYKAATLIGSNFADGRGNVMIGLSYANREPAYMRNHEFFSRAWTDPNTTGASQPLFPAYNSTAGADAIDAVFGELGYPAGDVSPRTSSFYYIPGATVNDASIFVPTAGLVSGEPALGYTGPLYPDHKLDANGVLQNNVTEGYLSLPMESYSAFLSGYYELTDNVEFYVQGGFDHKQLTTRPGTYIIAFNQWTVDIPRGESHPIPDSLATLLDSRANPDAPWQLQTSSNQLGMEPRELHNTTNTFEMLAGFRGDTGIKDWTYDFFISHGVTNQRARYNNYMDYANFQELISQPNYGEGAQFIDGRRGIEASCTSGVNPFLDRPVTQDCIDIINPDIDTTTDLTQDMLELNLQGGLFELPAGEVRMAFGGAYRKNKFDYQPDKGLSAANINTYTFGLFGTTPTSGEVSVKEIYGEVLVPILSDAPMVQSLELNAGIRYSDYNNIGGVTTWKTTGDWAVNDFLKFRGGYQVANRAPNVAELFQPPVFTVVGWPDHDPCSNLTRASYGNVESNPNRAQVQELCTALNGGNTVIDEGFVGNVPFYFNVGRDLTQGNPNLNSEKAKTWTFGTVINSPFDSGILSDVRLGIDYYNIKITGAISPASTQVVYQECFNDLGNNPTYDPEFEYCQRILREPDGLWIATIAQFENLGKIQTSGVDVTLNWGMDAPGVDGQAGRVFADVMFNYLDEYKVQNNPGGPVFDYAGSVQGFTASPPYGAQFRWKLNTTLGYSVGPAVVRLNWRHLPSTKNVARVTNPDAGQIDSKSFNVFDLTANWTVNDTLTLRGGIENLFDANPRIVGALPGVNDAISTTASNYDQLGRRFYFGIGADF